MRLICILTFLATSLASTGMAWAASADQQLQELHKKIGSVAELSSDFKQSVYRNTRKRTTESMGKAYFVAPNKFRWILSEPNEEFRFDGKSLLIVKPDEKLATRYVGLAAQTKEIQQIVGMVLDLKSLSERYTLKSIDKQSGIYRLVFLPKASQADITTIEIDIVDEKFFVQRVKMNYSNENYTDIVFSNQLRSVPAGVIAEKLPADYKVKELK